MLNRLTREPALVLGVVTAALGLIVLFGVHLSNEQIGGIVTFLGALMALVRFLTTPANEVLAQVKPDGTVVAGAATTIATGTELAVDKQPGSPAVLLPLPVDPDAP